MYGGDYAICNVVSGQTYQWQTCGDTDFDTQLTLWPGTGCSGGSLAYNDDFCGLQSQITWTATFTGTVRILVSRYSCTTQSTCMTLQWRCTTCSSGGPANDLCVNATTLPCGTTNLAGTTVGTSNLANNTGCSMGNYGVWYTFVGDGQSTTISSTSTGGWDHEMAIMSGTCASPTNIACIDNALSNGTETYTFTTVNGVTYLVYISHWLSGSTTTGTFTISRTCISGPTPPANDLCGNATLLPCGTNNLAGTTVNTSNIAHLTGCSISNYGVWYTFVGNGQSTTISSTSTGGWDHEMAIMSGTCASPTNIACIDNALSNGTETYTFTAINGVTYLVYISHWLSGSTTTGTFTISRTCSGAGGAPIQDCIGAMTICNDATVPGNASGEGVEEINSSNNGCLSSGIGENQSSWYIFSPTTSGNIALFMDVNTSTDYDWAVWGPYPSGSTTSSICPPNQQPIRCSFASGGTTFSATGSYDTGMGSSTYSTPQFAPPTPAIYDGTGNTLNGWTPGLQVTAGQVYVLLVDNWSADSNPFTLNFTLSGGATLGCTVLPIELLNFNIKNLGGENLLDWSTASEMNSDCFIIEKATDADNNFKEIGRMKAMGNSHIQVGYAFIDKKPNYGYNYYRLKMVDFDGSYKYSEIKAVKNIFDSNFAIKSIYPNPTSNDFYIDIETNTNENLVITLTDIYGKKLSQFEYSSVSGNNRITINTDKIERGLIFINITSLKNSNINITQIIVKQ
jgi:hypothetical protein